MQIVQINIGIGIHAEIHQKIEKKTGAAPGSLAEEKTVNPAKSKISITAYNDNSFDEVDLDDIDAAPAFVKANGMTWIRIVGIQDTSLLSRIGELFNIHALTLEDVSNPGQRPKFEDFDDYFFVALKQVAYGQKEKVLSAYQISFIVCQNVLISFQEKENFPFEPVRKRIRTGRGRIRKSGSGYLSYALIDSVVDHYFHTITDIGEDIEFLEQEMLECIDAGHLERIHGLKREMNFLRKQIWPVREAVSKLMKSESPLLPESTDRFLADVSDHVVHILDTIDSFRELLSSMLDLYMSTQSNLMNDVMRTLTIIATIFIPLTFLAGIYGMNFKFMPELNWQWGCFGLLGMMLALGGAMVIYFKRKKGF